MPFQIIRNDITKVKADAIVNTANPKPTYGAGTDSAIYKAAGEKKLLAERKKIGDIDPGEVAVTPAFDLNARYIIHTVGPAWVDGNHGEYEILGNCYRNSLEKALELKCRSIAFPLIATGIYGFPKDKALQIALSVIQPFVMEHQMKVTLVVFDRKSFELSGSLIENIREYVDDNYVGEARKAEFYGSCTSLVSNYYDEQEYRERTGQCETETSKFHRKASKPALSAEVRKSSSIKDIVASPDKTFQEKLFEIIDERGLSGPQVYTNYVSRQVYSKIQGNKNYHPNKYTAIAFCLSLHLDIDETLDLIGRAGWTLSPSNKADLIVKGCILNREYNILNIDLILFDFGCEKLEKIK